MVHHVVVAGPLVAATRALADTRIKRHAGLSPGCNPVSRIPCPAGI